MKTAVGGKTLDGGDVCPIGLHGEHGARLNGLSIDQDSACTTDRSFTAHVRAGQPQQIAQVMHQQQTRLDLVMMIDTIDIDIDSLVHKLPRFKYSIGRKLTYLAV